MATTSMTDAATRGTSALAIVLALGDAAAVLDVLLIREGAERRRQGEEAVGVAASVHPRCPQVQDAFDRVAVSSDVVGDGALASKRAAVVAVVAVVVFHDVSPLKPMGGKDRPVSRWVAPQSQISQARRAQSVASTSAAQNGQVTRRTKPRSSRVS